MLLNLLEAEHTDVEAIAVHLVLALAHKAGGSVLQDARTDGAHVLDHACATAVDDLGGIEPHVLLGAHLADGCGGVGGGNGVEESGNDSDGAEEDGGNLDHFRFMCCASVGCRDVDGG